jgi:hypothetical protein
MTEEQRSAQRFDAIVVVSLDDKGSYGVARDASERGLLIATRHVLETGDRLNVTLQTSSGAIERSCRVVRVTVTPPEEAWRFRVALELDEPLPKETVDEGSRVAATFDEPAAG